MIRIKATITEKGPGFQQLLTDMAGGEITVGVHGEEGAKMHPDADMTVAEVMAMHELGLGKQRERSWLRKFLDGNQERYERMAADTMASIMAGRVTRKQGLERLGYLVTDEMRENIVTGKIEPALAPSTVAKKGHGIPLLASAAGVNAITFKLFLKNIKSIGDAKVRAALRGRK